MIYQQVIKVRRYGELRGYDLLLELFLRLTHSAPYGSKRLHCDWRFQVIAEPVFNEESLCAMVTHVFTLLCIFITCFQAATLKSTFPHEKDPAILHPCPLLQGKDIAFTFKSERLNSLWDYSSLFHVLKSVW